MEDKYLKMASRIIMTIAIFLVVYYGGNTIRKISNYDAVAEAIYYLAGVAAAGCYWIASRETAG